MLAHGGKKLCLTSVVGFESEGEVLLVGGHNRRRRRRSKLQCIVVVVEIAEQDGGF